MTIDQTTGYTVEYSNDGEHSWIVIGGVSVPAGTTKLKAHERAVEKYRADLERASADGSIGVRVIPDGVIYADEVAMKQPPAVLHIGNKPITDYRSAITGEFVSAEDAARNLDTTVREAREAA